MTLYDLPVQTTLANFSFQTDMDGKTYGLQFTWNERFGAWFMSLFDVNGNPLVCGVRVVVDFPLAHRGTNPALPPGIIIAQDTTGAHQDPGLNDLGTRCIVQYVAVGSDG